MLDQHLLKRSKFVKELSVFILWTALFGYLVLGIALLMPHFT